MEKIPFYIKRGRQPCSWIDENRKAWKLGNPRLQKEGLPIELFKIIAKSGLIAEVKEKEDGECE